jgi:hypothetical protein
MGKAFYSSDQSRASPKYEIPLDETRERALRPKAFSNVQWVMIIFFIGAGVHMRFDVNHSNPPAINK